MRRRYIVKTSVNGHDVVEGFTKPGIESLKNLNMLIFVGTRREVSGIVYEYIPRVR